MKKDLRADLRAFRGTVAVTVEVPKTVDDLVTQICQMDGSCKREFYEDGLLDYIASYLNTGELFDLAGLGKTFRLKKHLRNLDPDMFGATL